jgi:hypothetical protein
MNDVPIPRFVAPVFNDDEFGHDNDIESLMFERAYACPFVEWLKNVAA